MRTSNDAFHVSRGIDRLVRERLIRRDADPADRRRARIELTAAGRVTHRAIERMLTRDETHLLKDFSDEERASLQRSLAQIDERVFALSLRFTWKDFV